MIRRFAPNIILILLFTSAAIKVIAQPSLPDISAVPDKDGVILSWNCQYSGIKAISVLRSADSTGDFGVIGYVKRMDAGEQSFTDPHPRAGRNYYKLAIVFNKGLTWRSNLAGVNVSGQETKQAPSPAQPDTKRPADDLGRRQAHHQQHLQLPWNPHFGAKNRRMLSTLELSQAVCNPHL